MSGKLNSFSMIFCAPCYEFLDSWKDFVKECDARNIHGFWDYPSRPDSWEHYIDLEESRRCNSDDIYSVPSSTFWLVDDGVVVAVTNIRHFLNEKLKKIGGHIGYYVNPLFWENGFGTKILELALGESRNLGMDKVLLTCSDENLASAKIIEKNGGVLSSKELREGELIRYYSISL